MSVRLTGAADFDPWLPREQLIDWLAVNRNQRAVAHGQAGFCGAVEIFASAGGETFSLVLTGADGRSCVLYTGRNWSAEAEGQLPAPVSKLRRSPVVPS